MADVSYNKDMNEIIERLQTGDLSELLAENKVALAYLFGSQARGETWAKSDVDIAVLFATDLSKKIRFQHVLTLSYKLGRILQRDDVQVVDLQQASPLLRHRVYYDGRLLYCPDDAVRVKFETTALRDYVDTAPLRRLKEKYILARYSEAKPDA